MYFVFLKVVLIQLFLPLSFIVILWREKDSKFEWVFKMLTTVMIVVWVFLTGHWDWVSYYIRYILILLLLVCLFVSWKKVKNLPFDMKQWRTQKINTGLYALLIIIFGFINVSAITGYSTQSQAIDLRFPLKNGTYYIVHGGSDTQLNYHHAIKPQQFALDIVKLNKFGMRATGFYPKDLDKYVIYDDVIYSPCDGKIIESRNDMPDLIPPEMDEEHKKGNYVAISCNNNKNSIVYIVHMQQNNVKVIEGDNVKVSEPIGLVGNSGNTSEPHLHIHAEKEGIGIPIEFDGEFLIRNSLVR